MFYGNITLKAIINKEFMILDKHQCVLKGMNLFNMVKEMQVKNC